MAISSDLKTQTIMMSKGGYQPIDGTLVDLYFSDLDMETPVDGI